MLNNLFSGVFDSTTQSVISVPMFLLCVGVSLAIGIFLALVYSYKNQCTKSFVTTLALLPSIVCVVIMMVNGNIGAGVAVAGAFSLVRFRSVPGSAKEICLIFMAMGTGLVAGMGYLGFAVVFALILGAAFLICNLTIATGDDGIHADSSLKISGGIINVTESYEGIEGFEITVSGGTISVVSSDDGFNAAGGNDSSGYGGGMPQDNFSADSDAKITISGGKITVDAKGDGLDSNGSLCVSGGEIFVTGPSDNDNGALDYNGDAQITGGTIVAVGMSGMTQNFGSSSTQGSILSNTATNTSGEVVLKDSNGNVLVSFTPTREYNSVVVSTPDVKKGSTYTLTTGDSSTTIEMSDIIYGESTQGRTPNGGGQGGPNGRGQAPNGNMGGGFGNRL